MSRLSVPADLFPALDELFNGRLWNRWADERRVFPVDDFRKAVRHVRLKPASSCRLVVFAPGADHVDHGPPGFILHLFPDEDRASVAFAKHTYQRSDGSDHGFEPFLSRRHCLVAVPFPNDPRIPGLRHLYNPHRLRSILQSVLTEFTDDAWKFKRNSIRKDLLSYKPGERAAYRIDARVRRIDGTEKRVVPLHVKLGDLDSCDDNFRKMNMIHTAVADCEELATPRPVGIVPDLALSAAEWIDGPSLQAAMSEPGRGGEAMRMAGLALACLHRLRLDLETRPSLEQEAISLQALGDDLALLLPADEIRVRKLGARLGDRVSELSGLSHAIVHGDFHLGQILVPGERPVIVDVDRAGIGFPLFDVASFLAHLEELPGGEASRGRFLDGYVTGGGESFGGTSLQVALAADLFRRTVLPFRRLLPNWPVEIRARLDHVQTLLETLGE